MKTIVTSEQIEFNNSYFSLIFPKQPSLKIILGVERPGRLFVTKAEDLDDLGSLKVFSDYAICCRVEDKNKIVKFHKGLLSRLYYYLRLDFLFDLGLIYKDEIAPRFGAFQLNSARTIKTGANEVRKFLQELSLNGYDIGNDLVILEKLAERARITEKNIVKHISIKNVFIYLTVLSLLSFALIIFGYFLAN